MGERKKKMNYSEEKMCGEGKRKGKSGMNSLQVIQDSMF